MRIGTRFVAVEPGASGTYPSPTYPVVQAGETLYFSGIVGMDQARELVGPGDAGAQAERALTTVAGALAALGGSLADIVHLTVYLVDEEDLGAVGEVLDRRLGRPWPPTTVVAVAALARPGFLVEIEPTAVVERSRRPRWGWARPANLRSARRGSGRLSPVRRRELQSKDKRKS